jgi:UDP-N-acetylmuramoyl-tripeptide--D-alanyl-D-alanine ligase
MIRSISLQQLVTAYGGQLMGVSRLIHSVSTDTRSIARSDCFVALRGEQFDGHDYLQQALDKGVAIFVIEKSQRERLAQLDNISAWLVDDTTIALGQIAQLNRSHFSRPVVAITGSSGKTSVKGMLAEILGFFVGMDAVFATKGNLNNHIGVPLSLLSINRHHHFAVIEMGASAGGEIAYLSSLAKPTVAMINNVMPAHVEGFGSVDAIATAKGEIYSGLAADGVALINGEDAYAPQWFAQNRMRSVIIFSPSAQHPQAQVAARNYQLQRNGCYSFSLTCGDHAVVVKLQVLGKHNIANAVAAAACAFALGLNIEFIRKGLERFQSSPGRMRIVHGHNNCTLIDDTYNANPGSVKAAIDVLAEMPGKTILVLGDMAELGDEADAQHQLIGRYAAEKNIQQLFTLGNKSALTAAAFGTEAHHCDSLDVLINEVAKELSDDVAVLVKGSRSSRMERVIQALQSIGDNNNASVAR